jgi:alpha-tubulin suppressor-like RCC1 family protein
LAINPTSKTLAVANTFTFSVSGGVSPYIFSANSGAINASSGLFTASGSPGSATVTVADHLGNTSNATVTVNAALTIAPTTKTTTINSSTSYTATGGVPPYAYSVISTNGGSFSGSTYTAPTSTGTYSVKVTDSFGNISIGTVTVNAALSISPSTETLATGDGFTFGASGGIPPYVFSTNSGTINSSSGYYLTPGSTGTANVTVTDSIGETSTAIVTINFPLFITPATLVTIPGNTSLFSALDGVSPYVFSVIGTGSITTSSSTGTYAAGSSGSDTVRVTDSVGNITNSTVTIRKLLGLAAGDGITCALISGGSVECWGYNGSGGLGNGTYTNSSTPVVVSGISNAIAIATGEAHGCALISGGTVKCWGQNMQGQLGNNGTSNSALAVSVSGITTAIAITAGDQHTCALLSSGIVQCWGQSLYGELGNGTSGTRSLVPVNVTGISTATAIASGPLYNVCAILSSGGVQCWGQNQSGQLGNGTTTNSSVPVNVTGISTATTIAVGSAHVCVTLSGGTTKCWGSNSYGELGYTSTSSPFISTTPVNLAVSGISSATSIAAGFEFTCISFSGGSAQCLGYNADGELGNGSTTSSSSAVSISSISNAAAVTATEYSACVLLSSGAAKCWGQNGFGQLGNGTTTGSLVPVQIGPWQ